MYGLMIAAGSSNGLGAEGASALADGLTVLTAIQSLERERDRERQRETETESASERETRLLALYVSQSAWRAGAGREGSKRPSVGSRGHVS